MGWIADLLGVGAKTALGYGNLAYQMQRDSGLTGAEREANAFSAQQAEIARDWQEKFYNQYESPQALIRQAQEAGINPAAIFGNAMGGSAPSASAPSSVAPKGGDVGGAVAQLVALSKQIAEIDLIKAQTDEAGSRILVNKETANKIAAEVTKLAADEDAVRKSIEVMGADISVKTAQAALYAAEQAFQQAGARKLDAESTFQEWRNGFVALTGNDPTSDELGVMAKFVLNFLYQSGDGSHMEEAYRKWNEVFDFLNSPESSPKKLFKNPFKKD